MLTLRRGKGHSSQHVFKTSDNICHIKWRGAGCLSVWKFWPALVKKIAFQQIANALDTEFVFDRVRRVILFRDPYKASFIATSARTLLLVRKATGSKRVCGEDLISNTIEEEISRAEEADKTLTVHPIGQEPVRQPRQVICPFFSR